MRLRHAALIGILSAFGGLACAGAPVQITKQPGGDENLPTAENDRLLLDAWMAASRGMASGNRSAEAEAFRPKAGEVNAIKLLQWAIVHPDRQAGWRACLDLKSRQDQGSLSAFSPWPFVCRAMLLAEQRMFDQSDRMLGPSNIKLASIEVAYVMGHLQKKRFDKMRGHIKKAREVHSNHPMIDLLSSVVATDKSEELRFLEAVYEKDKRHFGVLTRLAKFYDASGDPRATELLLAAANVNPKNTELRILLANRFRKENQLIKARDQYLEIVKAVPFHEGALTFLADEAAKRNDAKAQLGYLQALIKKVKDTKERRLTEAKLLVETKQTEAAEQAYINLLKRYSKLAVGHLYLARVDISRGKPFAAIERLMKAGPEGRKELAAMGDRYEVGKPLPTKGKSLNPTIWKAEAVLKARFKEARKRAPLIKGGRVSWDLVFDQDGQCVKVSHNSSRVVDPWFLVGGYLLQLGINHKAAAGGEISWDLNVH
jgi:tetratricopeptide (TPR) repeat protein